MTHGCGIPVLLHRQLLACLARSASSQQMLLNSSIAWQSQHDLLGRAYFIQADLPCLSEPDLPIDLLGVVEIAEIQILDCSPEKQRRNFSFPNLLSQPQCQLHTIFAEPMFVSRSLFPFELLTKTRCCNRFSVRNCPSFLEAWSTRHMICHLFPEAWRSKR